jgi:putative ABC transport system permease protein
MTAAAGLRLARLGRIAVRDLTHGWQSTGCLVIATAAALAPLLLLFALKFGVVANMIDTLRSDPRTLEVVMNRDVELSPEWMERLAADPKVGFLLPRMNGLAASVRARGQGRSFLESDLVPTRAGDPLTVGLPAPAALTDALLTERAALELEVSVGDTFDVIVARRVAGEDQSEPLAMTVIGVIPRDVVQSDDIYVAPTLEIAVNRYKEGRGVAELGWPGEADSRPLDATPPSYANFRLFAADVRDVPALRDQLLVEGFDVRTRSERIEEALVIEAGLGWVFAIVTTLALVGFFFTLGLHLTASVVEKSSELALLRLLGMRSSELALMPSIQGALIAVVGAFIASVVTMAALPVLNAALDGLGGLTGAVARLQPGHFATALVASAAVGAAAGSIGGLRAARIEPREGLRDD